MYIFSGVEEERQYLHPPAIKLARSLSMPGPEEIPPPPNTSAPEPPLSAGLHPVRGPALPSVSQGHYQVGQTGHPTHAGYERGGTVGVNQQVMVPTLRRQSDGLCAREADVPKRGGGKVGGLRRGYSSATPPTSAKLKTQHVPQHSPHMANQDQGGGVSRSAGRRGGRGALTKQSKVEDGLRQHRGKASAVKEKSSIPIPTIIVKAPSTSSSGRSSQGSSMEAEPLQDVEDHAPADAASDSPNTSLPSPLMSSPPQPPTSTSLPSSNAGPSVSFQQDLDSLDYTSSFATTFGGGREGGARRERERFKEMRRKSASFFLSSEEDIQGEAGGGIGEGVPKIQPLQGSQMDVPMPRLRPSKSIDEGMFSGDNYVNYSSSMPPAFGLPEYSSSALSQDGQPKSAPSVFGMQPTTFIHPLTGKVLDPSSPLGLALAARERALKDDRRTRREDRHFGRQLSTVGAFPTPVQTPTPSLFATPTQSAYTSPVSLHLSSPTATTSPASLSRPQSPRILRLGGSGGGERTEREKEGGAREGLRVRFSEDRNNQYSNQYHPQSPRERHREKELYDARTAPPIQPPPPPSQPAPRRPSFLPMESTAQENYIPQYTVPTAPSHLREAMDDARSGMSGGLGLMVLPPPAPSIDVDDEFVFADPLPPPLQFANGKKDRAHQFPRQHQQPSQQSAHVSPPPPPPLPPPKPSNTAQPSPQGGDSAASSLTSYDSEVANLTQSALSPSYPSPQIFPPSAASTTTITASSAPAFSTVSLHRPHPVSHSHPFYSSSNDSSVGGHPPAQDRGSAALTTTMTYATTSVTASAATSTTTTSPSSSDYSISMAGPKAGLGTETKVADHAHNSTTLPKSGDWQDAVVDSGIEELDSHSSSDHHLEMLGLSGLRPERGGAGRAVEAEKIGENHDVCITYSGGQAFEVQSARLANPPFPKTTQYKEGGGKGLSVALRRQNSTNPAPLQLQRPGTLEDARLDASIVDERNRKQIQSKMEYGFSSALAACLERPVDSRSVSWDEVGEHDLGGGRLHRDRMALEGRRLHSPLSGVKASILNELSSKLQQMSSMKSMDDWSNTPKSPTMHRFV